MANFAFNKYLPFTIYHVPLMSLEETYETETFKLEY